MTVRKAQHDYLLPASEWFVNNEHFAGAASSTITVPAGYTAVYFSSTAENYWVQPGATATIPALDITDGTSPFRNPAGLKELGSLPGGQFTISTDGAGEVTMFFARAVQS